jgi:hypothetical protein
MLVGKPEGKRTPGRTKRRWVENIKMDLSEIKWGGMDCSGSGQGTVGGFCEHGNKLPGSINFSEVLE